MDDVKIDRTSDEAETGGFIVQRHRPFRLAGRNRDARVQHDARKLPRALGGLVHEAFGGVLVGGHDDAVDGAEVEIPKLMAGG